MHDHRPAEPTVQGFETNDTVMSHRLTGLKPDLASIRQTFF